jgi:hypothetical protein
VLEADRSVRLNLNPGWADNNVSLVGTLDASAGTFVGTWDYANFTGRVASGSFEAYRR